LGSPKGVTKKYHGGWVSMASRFTTTTKDVGLLRQLYQDGQLQISAEFQRNAIWPRAAKAFLIDSILTDSPIPVLYFQRGISAQTNRIDYTVVDGQQRLNAVFLFMENRFALTESDPESPWFRKRWKQLDEDQRTQILSYDFVIQELVGYSSKTVRDMFKRMNRYVVALNPQELRHAAEDGAFKALVEQIGAWPFWTNSGVVSKAAAGRMKNDELVAELLILLNEGPQDKKESVDLYYESFQADFEPGAQLEADLRQMTEVISRLIPHLAKSQLRRPANIYALVGALSDLNAENIEWPSTEILSERLRRFEEDLGEKEEALQTARASRYLVAQSRQTDNIRPRRARIEVLRNVLMGEA
jgi:hypothetical protein